MDLPYKVTQSLRIPIIYTILAFSILISAYIALSSMPLIDTAWRIALGFTLILLAHSFLKRKTTWYVLDALEIIEHSGIILHKLKRIPLNRITNYETQSRVMEKISGLAELAIDTSGGTGFEMVIREIPREKLKYFMESLSILLGEQKIIDAGSDVALARKRKDALSDKAETLEIP